MNDINVTSTNKKIYYGGTTSWDNKNKNLDSVNNGKDVNTEITEHPVTIKPRRLNAMSGHNYEVYVPSSV